MIPVSTPLAVQAYNSANRPVSMTPSRAVTVTPSITTVLDPGVLYVGTGGNVKVSLADDVSTFVTFSNVPSGTFLPVLVSMVHTDTTASNILICY